MSMNLHSLKSTPGSRKARMRVGRGESSGKGKTSGKGHKGQMSRTGHKHKPDFEGGQMRLARRIPKMGFTNPAHKQFLPVNVADLAQFEAGTEVTPAMLRAVGLVKGNGYGVKILGEGELTVKLTVKAQAFSAGAKAKIEAAGGTVEVLKP